MGVETRKTVFSQLICVEALYSDTVLSHKPALFMLGVRCFEQHRITDFISEPETTKPCSAWHESPSVMDREVLGQCH